MGASRGMNTNVMVHYPVYNNDVQYVWVPILVMAYGFEVSRSIRQLFSLGPLFGLAGRG